MDRPALNQLREYISVHPLDVVVCYELDRLSRKTVYQLLIEEEFAKKGVLVEYVLGNYDNTPEGQLMKQIKATVAEYERAKIMERMARGKKGRAQAGQVTVGRIAPYGYDYVGEPHKGQLVINEEEAAVVQLIFEWYVRGDERGQRLGAYQIARRLSEMKVPTKDDSAGYVKRKKDFGVWGKSTVQRVLTNEAYVGIWHWGRTRKTSKTTNVRRPSSEWISMEVPAIISEDLFRAARQQAEQNKKGASRNTHRQYLMQGRLVCAVCGMRFRVDWDKRILGPEKGHYYCGGQKLDGSRDYKTKTCSRFIRQEMLDAAVWELYKSILRNPDFILEGISTYQTKMEAEASTLKERRASIEAKMNDVDAQRRRLLDLYLSNDGIPKELLTEKLAELAQRNHQLAREAEDLDKRIASNYTVGEETIAAIRAYCVQAEKGLDGLTFEEKRRALEVLNVTAVLKRGATAAEDVIVLNGHFGKDEIALGETGHGIATISTGSCTRR